jgi:anion-transporting  ArsA/GET3 family ATPase
MLLDDLLRRRLLLLTGKGGVGKSLVGAALAMAAVRRGKRVLLVEVDAPSEVARYFEAPNVGERVTEIARGLFAVNLRPRGVMDEYVRQMLKLPLLVDKVLRSPIYDRFFTAAPGLKELMLLGKVMVLEEERAGFGRPPKYDLVVLDAPATGHGLSLLKVPGAAARAAPIGPIGSNARRIEALLRNPEKTALVLVALPEEMAVVEALQFAEEAREQVGIAPSAVVLNAVHERRFSAAEEARILALTKEGADGSLGSGLSLGEALRSARRQVRRRKLSRFYETRLRRALDAPLVTLPFLFAEEIGRTEVARLADRLDTA